MYPSFFRRHLGGWREGTILTILLGAISLLGTSALAENVIFSDNFAGFTQDYNPWACVDGSGQITGIVGNQLVVDDAGAINSTALSPSVAAGDLNGDGLPDLVIADSAGFFWYLQNHGTKKAPLFTKAEIMPIWLGDPWFDYYHQEGLVTHNVVPRIQLVDINGDGKLDLAVGTYPGKLFYLINQGSTQTPAFSVPSNLDDITIATRREGTLWCNFLAPFLYDWQHNGVLDLLMGDGSYSANSIYHLRNKGSSDDPTFREDNMEKLIPGMGREHLIPQVVSWNGDGRADILTSERAGYVNIFLNQGGNDSDKPPTFDQGNHVTIGGQDKLPELSTVSTADLTGTGLPGLLIATTDGHISFSPNVGSAKNFKFGPAVPLKSTETKPSILRPDGWSLDGGYGSPYDLLVCTNPKVEPGFTFPDDPQVTSALRFYRDEPAQPNPTFPDHFYPKTDFRTLNRAGGFPLKADTRYTLSMWVKVTGDINGLNYSFQGWQPDPANPQHVLGGLFINDGINAGNEWSKYVATVQFTSLSDDRHGIANFDFHLIFNGKGSLYVAAVKFSQED